MFHGYVTIVRYVTNAFLWNIADRVEYSGQGEDLADRGRN